MFCLKTEMLRLRQDQDVQKRLHIRPHPCFLVFVIILTVTRLSRSAVFIMLSFFIVA